MDPIENQISIIGIEEGGDCGYCKSPTSIKSTFYIYALALSPQAYQELIDCGWRRSGKVIYKPNLKTTCCKQITIRLDCSKYILSKSSRKVISKIKSINQNGINHESDIKSSGQLEDLIRSAEDKRLVIKIELATFENESFDLYQKYQQAIHGDSPEKVSKKSSYTSFLVDSPLKPTSIYGTFHQKYYIDSKLIAFAVLDILPNCISSVYFVYDPDYSNLSLGVYSALREIALVKSYNHTFPNLCYYYMGYYINTCPKMSYKAKHKPSELLCPVTLNWVSADIAIRILNEANNTFVKLSQGDAASAVEFDLSRCLFAYNGRLIRNQKDLRLGSERLPVIKEFAMLIGEQNVSKYIILMQ